MIQDCTEEIVRVLKPFSNGKLFDVQTARNHHSVLFCFSYNYSIPIIKSVMVSLDSRGNKMACIIEFFSSPNRLHRRVKWIKYCSQHETFPVWLLKQTSFNFHFFHLFFLPLFISNAHERVYLVKQYPWKKKNYVGSWLSFEKWTTILKWKRV